MDERFEQHGMFSWYKLITTDVDAAKVGRILMQLRMCFPRWALPLFFPFLALAIYGGVADKAIAHQVPSSKDGLIIGTVSGASAPEPGHSLSAATSRMLAGPPIKRLHRRKGLAVIADFADTRLEDWQGEGINNVAELSDQLHKMEEHWAWLSRGLEKFQWDILRVTLPVNLQADAYPSEGDYREAVATLAKQQINRADYDANRDGVVDSMWIIASNNGMDYDYLGEGGTSRNAGVNNFTDKQNSGSVVAAQTGNFNHELAHTLGIPDLYDSKYDDISYDTVHYLTIMSNSGTLPPQDFTAYERTLLGWVKPKVVRRTRRGIHLPSADERMKAVRVSTPRTYEYFLIEYRHRPDSGFGSNAPPYNGLAIYHVLEGSNQTIDPPLLKLEAADGYIAPGEVPQLDDFLYPENPNLHRPLVLRSYFGGQNVFQIDNLRWAANGGLVFDITVLPIDVTQINVLSNPSFEQGTSPTPDAWQPDAYIFSAATFTWETSVAKEGQRSVSILASAPNDARWIQTVPNLDSGKTYMCRGWIRGQDIATGPEAAVGANVSIIGGFTLSQSLSGSFDWTQVCVAFRPENPIVTLACRLGFYGSLVTGKAWFDDITLEPLESAF